MKQTFGAYIRETRLHRGLGLREFASLVGLSAPFISNMERGLTAPPSEPKIKLIANILEKNPDELLALTGRVASDVLEIILQDPVETTSLIRRYSGASSKKKRSSLPLQPKDSGSPLEFYPLETISLENHTAIVGESGSGKSLLTKHLIHSFFRNAQVKIYDSDASPTDWSGLEVIGRKGDYESIARSMSQDLYELDRRTELYGEGLDVGFEQVRVIEEYPSTAAELAELELEGIREDIGSIWLRKLLRRGRKYRIKIFAVAQEFEVNAWKIAGEGGLRRAFTVLYLGGTAYKALSQVKDTALRETLRHHFDEVQYPCFVDVKGRFAPALIPDLADRKPTKKNKTIGKSRIVEGVPNG